MGSENLDVNRGRAAGRPGKSGCERVFPAQFFAAVFHPDGGPTPGTPPAGAGIGDPVRERSGRRDDTANLTGVAASRTEAPRGSLRSRRRCALSPGAAHRRSQKAPEDAVGDALKLGGRPRATLTSGSGACVALSPARSTVAALTRQPPAIGDAKAPPGWGARRPAAYAAVSAGAGLVR